MKPLAQLINTQKAGILHQLFPQEIPAMLDFIQGMCIVIREDERMNRESWKSSSYWCEYSFGYWLQLAGQAESKIRRLRGNLESSHYVFSEQLFTDEQADFSIHCLNVYISTRQHPHRKFTVAVDLLFNP